jgi:hypothetical protein
MEDVFVLRGPYKFFGSPLAVKRIIERQALNGAFFVGPEPSANGLASGLRVTGLGRFQIQVDVQRGPWLPMSLRNSRLQGLAARWRSSWSSVRRGPRSGVVRLVHQPLFTIEAQPLQAHSVSRLARPW